MNKQEAIEKLKSRVKSHWLDEEIYGDNCIKSVELGMAIDIVNQIDEPEKPVVPQYVADFYESIKDDFEDGVYELCIQFYEDESKPSTNLYRWFDRDDSKPIETLVKMRLYGYEVERYKVALKSNRFGIGVHQEDGSMKTIFTREELAKYGFNNLDEYTVTEVEYE